MYIYIAKIVILLYSSKFSIRDILMCIVLTWCCEGGGFGARHRSYNSSGIASSRGGGVRELGSGSVSTGSCTTITISI